MCQQAYVKVAGIIEGTSRLVSDITQRKTVKADTALQARSAAMPVMKTMTEHGHKAANRNPWAGL